MTSRAEHLQQARDNLGHANFLLQARPNDPTALQWAVTAAFYCAVHCVEAHLVAQVGNSKNHQDRLAKMADPSLGIPAVVYSAYRKLKTRSEGGRYLLWRFTAAQVDREILNGYLAAITQFVGL